MSLRDQFLAAIRSRFLTPYRWDAKGPERFDCSGLVTWGLAAVGAFTTADRLTKNCAVLWEQLEPTESPLPGDLVFYGLPGHPNHVMVLVEDQQRVFGAAGGDEKTLTDDIAAQRGACVQYRPSVRYRADFLGYRRAPLEG